MEGNPGSEAEVLGGGGVLSAMLTCLLVDNVSFGLIWVLVVL